jgi:transcriptional regulator of NAD metabolism
MNERIKALLLNERNMFVNGVTESDNKIYIHGSEENLEKFAELIVKECADIATMNQYQPSTAGTYVIKHFGVEE